MKITAVASAAYLVLLVVLMQACGAPPTPQKPSPTAIATAPLVPPTAPAAAQPSDAGTGAPPPILLRYRGTNLSGAEFGAAVPGVVGKDYRWPTSAEADYFLDRGMNVLRIPFRHQRLQPKLQGPLDEAEWTRLASLVDHVTARGAVAVLEPHDSWRHAGAVLTAVQAGDFWGRVASRLKDNPRAWLNLTNEPHDMTTEAVVALDNAAIKEARRVGFTGRVLAPGNGFAGAMHWGASWYGTPNAKAMLGVVDAANATAIEAHLYLDADGSGSGADCVSPSIGVERLAGYVAWLRANKRAGFVGEIGAPNTPTCREAVTRAIDFMESSYDVLLGWAWWSSGAWSYASTYPLSIGPVLDGGAEKPQLGWLRPFLPAAPACAGVK